MIVCYGTPTGTPTRAKCIHTERPPSEWFVLVRLRFQLLISFDKICTEFSPQLTVRPFRLHVARKICLKVYSR